MIKKAMLVAMVGMAFIAYTPTRSWSIEDTRDYFVTRNDVESEQQYLDLVETHHLRKVLGFIREDRVQNAIQELDWTLDRFPNHPRALSLMEAVATIVQVPSLPVNYYEKAVSNYPQHAITHAQFGKYLVDTGKVEDGLAKLKHAIALQPNLPAANVWLSEGYFKSGNKGLAKKYAQQARALGYTGELIAEGPSKAK